MATVTIGKSYFEALLRRAEFHVTDYDVSTTSNLANNVLISQAEHGFLHKALQEYNMLKDALFKGGLTSETLETLLASERSTMQSTLPDTSPDSWAHLPTKSASSPRNYRVLQKDDTPPYSEDNEPSCGHQHSLPESAFESAEHGKHYLQSAGLIPAFDQRTIFITNLPEHTKHKDVAGIVRGGRLLEIYLRKDRNGRGCAANVSFVEGAAEFLAYTKRQDIYLHSKRLEFFWNDKQFRVPRHVANKIAGGATRNLIVRGGAGKLSEEQLRDHLDHIHNLVVVDIVFKDGDALISTNSIHNALYAKTCMISRTAYKDLRVDWSPDECAAPLPPIPQKKSFYPASIPNKPKVSSNIYALLDDGSESISSSENDEFGLSHEVKDGDRQWNGGVVV